jgi:hypothetical protein
MSRHLNRPRTVVSRAQRSRPARVCSILCFLVMCSGKVETARRRRRGVQVAIKLDHVIIPSSHGNITRLPFSRHPYSPQAMSCKTKLKDAKADQNNPKSSNHPCTGSSVLPTKVTNPTLVSTLPVQALVSSGPPSKPTNMDTSRIPTLGQIWDREPRKLTTTSRAALTAQLTSMSQ